VKKKPTVEEAIAAAEKKFVLMREDDPRLLKTKKPSFEGVLEYHRKSGYNSIDNIHPRDVTAKYWMGSRIGDRDDFDNPIKDQFIDGATRHGPWGIMSPYSHRVHGIGLGTGRGQRYKRQKDGQWLKVEG
jgi:hypothetical protein